MEYAEFNGSNYTSLRKRLLKQKGSEDQKFFLEAVRDSEHFLKFIEMEKDIFLTSGSDFPLYEGCLTENEFKMLSETVENKMLEIWDISPAVACRTSFWAKVTVDHVKAGKIESYYLAGKGIGGKERIDKVLVKGGEKIDDVVHTVLRCLGGLPEKRGNRSVYTDCSFARAWWQGYIAKEVSSETKTDIVKINRVFRKKTCWEKLIELTVSRNSVLGDSKVRSSLISCLADETDDEIFKGEKIEQLSRMLGVRQAIQELGVLDIDELKELISKELIPKVR